MGSSPKALKTSETSATPSSRATISLARAPENAGTSSWSDLSTSMYSGGSTSDRVDSTWPSLTKVGPSVSSLSRANVAAAVFSSLPCFRALSTLSAQPPRAFQTSTFRRMLLDLPRFSQPASSFSPSATSASPPASDTTDRRMSRASRPRVSAIFSSSRHSGSGSSTAHSSLSRSSTAASIAGSTTSRSAVSFVAAATAVSSFSSVVTRSGRRARGARPRGAM
mmetsp:Transcript_17260/g.56174  ORF Transcript_17260/g.56174 Transcript_17260/m.56174 type:complete len:223 (+) Transcript_17260:1422-2090(+)